jgi:hypothetical protein
VGSNRETPHLRNSKSFPVNADNHAGRACLPMLSGFNGEGNGDVTWMDGSSADELLKLTPLPDGQSQGHVETEGPHEGGKGVTWKHGKAVPKGAWKERRHQ